MPLSFSGLSVGLDTGVRPSSANIYSAKLTNPIDPIDSAENLVVSCLYRSYGVWCPNIPACFCLENQLNICITSILSNEFIVASAMGHLSTSRETSVSTQT